VFFSFCNLIRRITLVQDNDVYIVIAGLIIIITDIKNRRAEVVKLKSSLTKETNKREREFRKIATKNIASPLISHTTLNCLDLEQRRKIEQKKRNRRRWVRTIRRSSSSKRVNEKKYIYETEENLSIICVRCNNDFSFVF